MSSSYEGEMSHPPRLTQRLFRMDGREYYKGYSDILSRSQSETMVSVIDRRTVRGEEEVEGLRRWFKFLSLGKSPSIWGVAESTANSHALTGS